MTLELLQTFGWQIFFYTPLTSRCKLHTARTRSEVMSVLAGLGFIYLFEMKLYINVHSQNKKYKSAKIQEYNNSILLAYVQTLFKVIRGHAAILVHKQLLISLKR